MGRKTWESIGHALIGRTNIVISRNTTYEAEGCSMATSLEQGVDLAAQQHNKIFIIGGGQIYTTALPLVSSIYLSQLHRDVEGNVFFPTIDPQQFRLIQEKTIQGTEDFTIQLFNRIALK